MTTVSQLEMKIHKLTDKIDEIMMRLETLDKKISEHNSEDDKPESNEFD